MEPLQPHQREAIVNDDVQFKMYVCERLGELTTDMKSLVGNGQPGRVQKLEKRVDRLEWWAALAIGAGVFGSYLIHWGWEIGSALFH